MAPSLRIIFCYYSNPSNVSLPRQISSELFNTRIIFHADNPYRIPLHLFHDLAQTIQTWLILFPPTMLVQVVEIANALGALAMDNRSRLSTDIQVSIDIVGFLLVELIHCSRTLFFG